MADIQARWDIDTINNLCRIFKQETDGNILKLDLELFSDENFMILKSSHEFPISDSIVNYQVNNRQVSKGRFIAGPCDFYLSLKTPKSPFDNFLFSLENKVFTFHYSIGYSFKVSGVVSSFSYSSEDDDLIEFCVSWIASTTPKLAI